MLVCSQLLAAAGVWCQDVDGDGTQDVLDMVWYKVQAFPRGPSPCIRHLGDNTTGAGDGDDEEIYIHLDRE